MNMVCHLRHAPFLILVLVRNDKTSVVVAIRNFYGAVTVLAVISTYGAQKWEKGRTRGTPCAHRTRRTRGIPPPLPPTRSAGAKSVGRSHTYDPCERRASENFYDILAAFMSRVNLANSASFAPRHLARPFVVSWLTCRQNALSGNAIKFSRNDAVPELYCRREETVRRYKQRYSLRSPRL